MPRSRVVRTDDPEGDGFAVFDDGLGGDRSQGVTLCDDDGIELAALPVSGPLTDAELRATALPVSGPLTDAQLRALDVPVSDDYDAPEYLADQTGADAILSFTASAAGRLVWVDVDPTDPTDTDNYRARATIDGSDPSATRGVVCRPGATPIPGTMTGSVVKVYAPTGVVVAVQVYTR